MMAINLVYDEIREPEGFAIEAGNVRHGWMDWNIRSGNNRLSYTTGYLVDAPALLAKAFLGLVREEPAGAREGIYGNRAIVVHDLEGSSLQWYMQLKEDILSIVMLEDFDHDLLYELAASGEDMNSFAASNDDFPDDISGYLKMAFRVPALWFRQSLVACLKRMEHQYGIRRYEKCWGHTFPVEDLKRLEEMFR